MQMRGYDLGMCNVQTGSTPEGPSSADPIPFNRLCQIGRIQLSKNYLDNGCRTLEISKEHFVKKIS